MYSGPQDAAALERSLAAVPIPPGALPAAGTDGHMVIWQPSSDTVWELWIARYVAPGAGPEPGWHAAWGARIDDVSRSSGRVAAPFGATASGLPLLGGLIRAHELESGTIDHAISVAVPEVPTAGFVWPATRSDGNSSAATAIPEGTRFRLDPSLDLEALGLPPATLAMAEAAQRYGIVVTDRSDAVSFYAEDPVTLGTNPYLSLFGGQSPAALLAEFPWEHLQALAPPVPPS